MLVVLFYMVVIPLYRMVDTTITWQPRDLTSFPGAVVGEFTLYHYVRMLTGDLGKIYHVLPRLSIRLPLPLGHPACALDRRIVGLAGGPHGYAGQKTRQSTCIDPLHHAILDSGASLACVLQEHKFSGGTPGVFEFFVGQAPPAWLSYGPVPIIICSALHYYTFFFLFVSAALMSIDSSLEEAGELMGASRWRILRKITLPLVLPAILSGFIMTFSKVMGTFGGPNILGVPVRYYIVATMIRGSMGVGDKADGFVLAIVLILFSVITISINQKLIGTRKSYETIGGRGFMAQLSKLGITKHVMFIVVITFQILVIVLPLGLLIWSSLMLQDGNYSLSNLSLQHWIGERGTIYNHGEPGVLLNPKIYRTAWNSIRLSLWTGFIHSFFGYFSRLCNCQRAGHPALQIGRAIGIYSICHPWHCFWRRLYCDVHQAAGTDPGIVRDLRLAGDCFGGKTYSLFLPLGGFSHDASRPGTGGSGCDRRRQCLAALQAHHLPADQCRLCCRIPADLHHHHARTILDHPAGHPTNPGTCQPDHVLYRKWRWSDGKHCHFDPDLPHTDRQLHHWPLPGGSLKKGLGM